MNRQVDMLLLLLLQTIVFRTSEKKKGYDGAK